MVDLVDEQNFSLGCRVCRKLLKGSVCYFETTIPDYSISYLEAFNLICSSNVRENDELPQKLCSDCAARLCIGFQFRMEAAESALILNDYFQQEKTENDIYENKYVEEEEEFMYDMEELEDETSQTSENQAIMDVNGGNDAVSFLAGLLKNTTEDDKKFEIKKIKPKVKFEDPNEAGRKHACNVCNKKFQKRSNLIDHLRLHANVKVFACDFCEKSFVQAGNYKAHLRTHTKEKPFQCQYCDKSYSQSSSLKIHVRSHTQEKNYMCETCDKAFTNASDLGKHRMIHDPVKRYTCNECSRGFTQKIHLRKHIEKHHPELARLDSGYEYSVKQENAYMVEIIDA